MSLLQKHLSMTKMQGAGNSFLITSENISLKIRAKLTEKLCDINFGVGADGMVFLNSSKDGNVDWDFYNSDGSEAEFCGNAARCVALYIFDQNSNHKKIQIKTRAGLVACEMMDAQVVQVQMPKVEWLSKSLVIPGWPAPVVWLNTGVPHVVIEVAALADLKKYKSEAALIRSSDRLGPSGSNVTFVFAQGPEDISAVTFERGVEDFTLACGTGAVAAAYYMMEKNFTHGCQVKMPGGSLKVTKNEDQVLMTGEAYKIANIQWSLEGEI